MNDQTIEQQIKAKGLTAPRVTLDALNANIVSVEIVKHLAPSGQVLRWAVLTTRSGYAVTGRPSVSVSPENDNAELGEQIARDNARNELWALMGYALKERLASPTDEQVARFLTWPVPAEVYPDGTPGQPGRTGTNLLSAPQAAAMLRHMADATGLTMNAIKNRARRGWTAERILSQPARNYPRGAHAHC